MKFTRRGSTLYLRKRVPKRYHAVEEREYVWLSLHTDSESVARAKHPRVWGEMIEAWEAKLDGAKAEGEGRMRAARELAAKRGFRFPSAADVAQLPLEQIIERVERVITRKRNVDRIEAAALLGGARPPAMTVSLSLEAYWTIARPKTIGKSEDQIRRWENPRKKAVANFVDAVGDLALEEISTRDLFAFRQWWVDKMVAEGLTANSANKDFTHLTAMLKDVARAEEIPLRFNTEGLSIKDPEKRTRPPFSADWIREKILTPGALNGLNPEARGILIGMVNTGYRPSEGAMLTRDQIVLGANVPHLRIEPVNGRQLKTQNSRRVIPLAGVSLEAFRAHPDGFPRYADNPALSDTVNKFLRENGLLETPGHSMYSLRHSFEDRMLAIGTDERIRRDLMGHALQRERYGRGADLAHLHKVVQAIAL